VYLSEITGFYSGNAEGSTREYLEQINVAAVSLKLNFYLSKNSVIVLVEIA